MIEITLNVRCSVYRPDIISLKHFKMGQTQRFSVGDIMVNKKNISDHLFQGRDKGVGQLSYIIKSL